MPQLEKNGSTKSCKITDLMHMQVNLLCNEKVDIPEPNISAHERKKKIICTKTTELKLKSE